MTSNGDNDNKWGVQLPTSKRLDGRISDLQLRPIVCEVGVLKNASGSARFQFGLTSALAAVHGPNETVSAAVRKTAIVDRGSLQVVVRPLSGASTVKERYIESCVICALDSMVDLWNLPRTQILIVIQPESDAGGLLSCLMNAAVAALLDAGIPCTATHLSVSLICKAKAFLSKSPSPFVLDPTSEECLMQNPLCFDLSSYKAYTINIHTGALIQVVPECIPNATGLQQPINDANFIMKDENVSVSTSAALEHVNAASACVKLISDVLRQALEFRLNKIVTETIKANNFMELSNSSEKNR